MLTEASEYTYDQLCLIRENPHILGWIAGKTLLTNIHSNWINYCWDTDKDRCLQAHRDSYKTTSIAVVGSIWWLLFHPDDRIAIIRKSYTDAAEVVKTIKEIMKLPAIRELFYCAHGEYPNFRIAREGKIEFTFKKTITPEGSVNAIGLDGSITGKHFDKILCDDFVTLIDRLSNAKREKAKSQIMEIRTNIIDKGKCCAFIGTPWHKSDAWSILPKPAKFDVHSCGIFNEDEIEDKRRKTTPSLFAANYLLKHMADEGLLFSNPNFGRWTYKPEIKVYGHLDAAYDGIDTNALTFMANMKNSDKIQAVGKSFSGNVKNWLDVIEAEYKKRRCKGIYVEDNTDKGYAAAMLKSRGITVFRYSESMNKHIKISTHLYNRWDDIVWDDRDTDEGYLEQVVDYMKGQDPDDAPDSAASLVREKYSTARKSKSYDALYTK